MSPSIYEYIKSEENNFESSEIQVGDNMYWSFRNHVQLLFHLKNGYFFTGSNDWMRAFKNIMEPVLELSCWTEDIEVKDIILYTEDENDKVLSFLIKKYHDDIYTHKYNLEDLIDNITEDDLTFGGVLVQDGKDIPETIPMQSIAFCDQTDINGGPIAFKYYFSPDKLRSMSKLGWGSDKNGATISIDDLCVLANDQKDSGSLSDKKNKVTGKTIEVYIVRGSLPDHYLNDSDDMEWYYDQVHIVAFYTDKNSQKQGVTLYRKKSSDELMFFTSKEVYGRALGRGIGERLIHPQIWTNFLAIHKTQMLQAASKVPLYTDDPTYTQKNRIQDMENLEITTIEDGKTIRQVPTAAPANIQLYSNEINTWYEQAQLAGAANDPLLGKEAPSGTTFRGQERAVAQGRGSHDKRRGRRAKFVEEIYRKMVIPRIVKEINKGTKFLSTLSTEELNWVVDQLAENAVNKRIKELVLQNKFVTKQEQDFFRETFKKDILKKGSKYMLEVLKGEFEDIEIKIGINVANKQKNLADLSDKLLSIFQFVFQNPQAFIQAMQIPALAKSFENLLEFGGMSIADFSTLLTPPTVNTPTPETTTPSNPLELSQQTA